MIKTSNEYYKKHQTKIINPVLVLLSHHLFQFSVTGCSSILKTYVIVFIINFFKKKISVDAVFFGGQGIEFFKEINGQAMSVVHAFLLAKQRSVLAIPLLACSGKFLSIYLFIYLFTCLFTYLFIYFYR